MKASVEHLLHYLHSHSFEEAKQSQYFADVIADVQDVHGVKLQLKFKDPKTLEVLKLTGPADKPVVFNADPLFNPIPNTVIQPVDGADGTIYVIGNLPTDTSTFWLVQYPPSQWEKIGRTVIEFYNKDLITAVYKTDNDNFGGEGTGKWAV